MKRISFTSAAMMQGASHRRYFMLCSVVVLLFCALPAMAQTEPAPATASPAAQQAQTPERLSRVQTARDFKNTLTDWREKPAMEPSTGVMPMLQGLGLSLGVFFIAVYFLKRYKMPGQGTARRKLRVIERLPISSKTAVMLVEVGGQEIFLTVGSEHVTVLGDSLCGAGCCGEAHYHDQESAAENITADLEAGKTALRGGK